ncbi:alpha-L-rhamnosidase [Ereboglobus sp. PH5-10]|uniref:alpha-L-rhamnosidase n=1 Tax=Ereboglobus sp. PH5-10 TaxID=2940629 RepID=UPI002405D99F|nr:family 78 glycoside hydrolase catalytic domain [Ereboglobus sp. PH5-10]MDF9827154.1 alpha-L-rhamnosidase [Ereboglobus sp. PH5-10]
MKLRTLIRTAMLAGLSVLTLAASAGTIRPTEPRCEHRDNPLGLREVWPRLTWRLEAVNAADRGLVQSAWRVLVASTPEKLAANEGDVWDSGRIQNTDTRAVFAGRKLDALQQVWWKVRVWDGAGEPSDWSAPATWSRGLEETVNLKDWPGDWIGLDPSDAQRTENLTDDQRHRARTRQLKWVKAVMSGIKKRPTPAFDAKVVAPPTDTEMPADKPLTAWFSKTFRVESKAAIDRAAIWVVPDMECEIWFNGKRIGTSARWEITKQIDLTPHLREGENRAMLRVTQNDGYAPAVTGEIELFPSTINTATKRVPIDASWLAVESDAKTPDAPALAAAGAWKKPKADSRPTWSTPENVTHYYAPVAMLRKKFSVKKPVKRATLVATATGLYEVEINGARVGNDFFAPGCTEYRRRVHTQTYDVTAQVNGGANAIGITLADGWFAGIMGFGGKRHVYNGYPRARALLVIEHDDGTVTRVPTDRSWKAAFGPIRYADLMQGCGYDARLEIPGWSRADFNDSKWTRAASGRRSIPDESAYTLAQTVVEGATLDGVRITETLPARTVREVEPGVWLVDFGQNFVGWARLKTRGAAGTHVVFRHGEILNPNGSIHTSNLRGASGVDEFWMRDGEQTLEPRFTFHGFRYLEVRGLAQAPSAADFTGVVVHSPMKRTGWFESSDPALNQLFSNIIWGQRGNYLEIPTDCPQRDERLGWSGDTQFFARTASYNYDTRAFLERWIEAICDSQNAEGVFPGVAPNFPGYHVRPSTAWGDASIIVTHVLWQQYGETRQIERHFDALARYIGWLERRARDGIVFVGGYGDWLHKGGTAKTEVMDTAYYAYLCDLMSQMAEAIGRTTDAARYKALRNEVRAAFEREFLLADGSILESSQTGYALAFTMDLVPPKLRKKTAEKFNDSIKAFDWHLATGFIGTPRLMPGLFEAGLNETAWRVLMQDTYPSWLYQVKLGATTMWERWDGWTPNEGFQAVTMNSFNHYAFGAVGESLYRHVAGIETATPGFRDIVIRPIPGGGLTHARAAYEAATGRIESGWKVLPGGGLALDVTIPVGSRAKIHLPAKAATAVTESGRPLASAPGVRVIASETPGEVVCETGSGVYRFEVRP